MTFVLTQRGLFMGAQRSLQNRFYDTDSASGEIVIIAIDEKTLGADALGPLSSWTRQHYAWAMEALETAGVSAIGLDLTLPDNREGDEALADTLRRHDNIVLAARYYFENGQRRAELPNPTLLSAEPRLGLINVNVDPDGFVREIPVSAAAGDATLDAFSVALAKRHAKATTDIPVAMKRDAKTGENIPFMQMNYFSAPNRFRRISFTDIMNERPVDQNSKRVELAGKIALIGPTAADLQDYYLAPTGDGVKMPGVEIHANALQTILQKRFLREPSSFSLWLLIGLLLAFDLAVFSLLKVRYAVPLVLLELAGLVVAGVIAYDFGLILNVVYPAIAVSLAFIGVYLLRFTREQKQRRFIEGAFGHYVSRSVVEQIIKNPGLLKLGGAKREITTFFSDIAGFTTLSEKMEPEALVTFLNEYLQAMTTIILENDGTLDKYEGDAIMAFWGAPLDDPAHATKACRAALACQHKLAELREKWAREGKPAIHVRIGLNTGDAVVGNMGSGDRFDYTAMGDNVNLASRLEGINKQYGTEILASRSTHLAAKNDFHWRDLDAIRVKGKKEPVVIYELLQDYKITRLQDYQTALELYRNRKFDEAKTRFLSLKDDAAARVFAERCDAFIKNPPPDGWDGVWNFEVK